MRLVHPLLAHLEELPADLHELAEVRRLEGGRVRRGRQQELADETALAHGVGRVALVGVRVMPREAAHLAVEGLVVVIGPEIVAVAHEGDGTAVGRHLQAVLVQLERAIDLRPEQAAHVGAIGVDPVLVQVPADRRTADVVVLFNAHDIETGARKKSCRRQSVMSGADDDRVVGFHLLCSLSGRQAVAACLCVISSVVSTARSKRLSVSSRQSTVCDSHRNHGSRESGSTSTPSSCRFGASAS